MPPGCLIQLVVPVYGLDDAPLALHQTLTAWLAEQGFRRCLLDPCWWVKLAAPGRVEAMVLLEVDDMLWACLPRVRDHYRALASERFRFGKWVASEGDFAGRRVRRCSDRVVVDQEKYIIEELRPMALSRGRRGEKRSALSPPEVAAYRSMVYQVAWVARESRPEAAGAASLLASGIPQPTVEDAVVGNKMVHHLRSTASQRIVLWPHRLDQVVTVACSDCGGIGSASNDGAQAAWLVALVEPGVVRGETAKASVVSWRSSKLKRAVPSTLAGETQALSQALAEAEWVSLLVRDVVFNDVRCDDWRASVGSVLACLRQDCEFSHVPATVAVVDGKSVFDVLSRQTAGSRQDRRTSIDLAIIRDSLGRRGGHIRWVPHSHMPSDTMTNADIGRGNAALSHLLRHGTLRLREEDSQAGPKDRSRWGLPASA